MSQAPEASRGPGGTRAAVRALRGPLRILAFAAFGLSTGFAGEVPSPLFYEAESEFLQDVDNGQFDRHLELHLLEYSVDPRWAADWAARRYSSSGLLGAYGSISSQQLFVDSDVALNVFPHDRFQLRYEWKAYQDKRFDVSEQRLDALWYATAGWGVVFTCWPSYQKEEIAGGLGLKIGKPKSTNYLVVRAVDERLVWNEKTESGVRFTSAPLRIVADGNFDGGRYRVSGSVDYGLPYEAVEEAPGVEAAERSVRGHQRFADVGVERSWEGWAAGVRLTLGSLARRQEDASGTVFDLDRAYSRVIVNGRREIKGWTISGLAGVARQRDDFSSPEYPASTYTMDAFLIGAEGSKRLGKGLDLRAGYLGNFWRGERTGSGDGLLSAREEDT